MAGAFISKNSVLQLSVSSVYTTIARVNRIEGFSASVSTPEITDLASTARSFLAGITDYGSVSLSLFYDPGTATHANLTDIIVSPAVSSWKIIMANTDASVFAFDGILNKWDVKLDGPDGVVEVDAEIKISGAVTITV